MDALQAAAEFPFLTDARRLALLRDEPLPTVHAVLREAEWGAAGKALEKLPAARAAEALKDLHPEQAAGILSRTAPTFRGAALGLLPLPLRGSVMELLDFPEGSVARRMNPYLVTLPEDIPAGRAFEIVRESSRLMSVFYVYVVDRQGVLQGTLSVRRMLGADPEVPVKGLMERSVVTVQALAPAQQAADLLRRHRFLAVPVVDRAGRPLGVVTNADLADLLQAEADTEVYSAVGVRPEEEQTASFWRALKGRFPWFGITLSASLGSAVLARSWQPHLMAEAARVFLFAPLVLAVGESIGAQTGLVILHLGEGTGRGGRRMVRREMLMGLLLGGGCALLLASAAWVISQRKDYALLMATSIPLVGVWSALVGVMTPKLFRRMGKDPSVAAGPLILAAVDLSATAIYLAISVAILA